MAIAQPGPEVLQFLRAYQNYYLFSHLEPDGDCLTSSAALGRFLQKRGRRVKHFNPGPFIRVEIQSYREQFLEQAPARIPAATAAVVLDCSTADRIGAFAASVQRMPSLVIDHHSEGEPFGDIRYIEPAAPSTSMLIQLIMEAEGHTISAEEAQLLLFGLCTDTGFFRHLDVGQGAALAAAGRLVDRGASPRDAYNRMFGGRSLASRKLLAELITRARELNGGRCLITWETLEDVATYGKHNRDSDQLYQLLMGSERCTVIALARAETEASTSVSFRSRDGTDVGSLAKSLGGGGHRAAAGCTLDTPLPEAVTIVSGLLEAIDFSHPSGSGRLAAAR